MPAIKPDAVRVRIVLIGEHVLWAFEPVCMSRDGAVTVEQGCGPALLLVRNESRMAIDANRYWTVSAAAGEIVLRRTCALARESLAP